MIRPELREISEYERLIQCRRISLIVGSFNSVSYATCSLHLLGRGVPFVDTILSPLFGGNHTCNC